MLKIENLSAGYTGPIVIQNIHLQMNENEIVTIIGPNGAGKSTVLRSIFGLTKIYEGSIKFFNEELIGLKTKDFANRGVCYVPQGKIIFPNLTVEENLKMGAYIRDDKNEIKKDIDYVYKKFPKLFKRQLQKAKTMSGGEQQMICFGRALMQKPKLLLLDEPSLGLAPNMIAEIFEKIIEIKNDGVSILIVEQNANMALEISDRGYVLELGKNRYEGSAEFLRTDKRIGELYLGKRNL